MQKGRGFVGDRFMVYYYTMQNPTTCLYTFPLFHTLFLHGLSNMPFLTGGELVVMVECLNESLHHSSHSGDGENDQHLVWVDDLLASIPLIAPPLCTSSVTREREREREREIG